MDMADSATKPRSGADSPTKIVFSSYGSEGDSTPLINLAQLMVRQGDSVTLLLEPDGARRGQKAGLVTQPLAGDLRSERQRSPKEKAPTLRLARQNLAAWARQTAAAAQDADVIVGSGLGAEAAQLAARHLGLPFVGVTMFPIVPTHEFSSPLALLPVPKFLNRPTHSFIQHLLWSEFGRHLKPVCQEWQMELPKLDFTNHPTLCAVSPTLLPEPKDWPTAARVVGDLHPVSTERQVLAPELEQFLAEGPAPIYLGFGSMTLPHPNQLATAIKQLAEHRRVIFAPGWSGLKLAPTSNLFIAGHTPHEALFPRVAVVVHHGGAGTVHTAARLGAPQVIMPLGGDQAWWAEIAQRAQIAPPPLRAKNLTASALQEAIRAAESLRPNALEVSQKMSTENGTGEVARVIRQVAGA